MTLEEAENEMHRIAKEHGILYISVTNEVFEDDENFQKLNDEQKKEVLEAYISALEIDSSVAYDNALDVADDLANLN